MVDRVKTNKGFWVGRYETSNMSSSDTNDTTQQINVVKGTTTGISGMDWYRMYAQQKSYSKLALGSTTATISSMVWGSQWDQIMIWMRNVKNERVTTNGNYFVINSVGYGNYGSISGAESYDTATSTSSPAVTGSSDYFKVKNIYDLAGNVYDWTLEAYNTSARVHKGGDYDSTHSSYTRADFRNYNHGSPYFTYSFLGSRPTLY